jgi:hypothetical protein
MAAGLVLAFAGLVVGLSLLAWWLLAPLEDFEWDDDTEAEDRLTGGGW